MTAAERRLLAILRRGIADILQATPAGTMPAVAELSRLAELTTAALLLEAKWASDATVSGVPVTL